MTRRRDIGACLLCGRPAAQFHHWTARGVDGSYLDPTSTIPLCVRCHATEGQCWHEVGIDELPDPLVARVRRTMWTVGRLADLNRPVTFDALTLRGFHAVMLAIGRDVDARLRTGLFR